MYFICIPEVALLLICSAPRPEIFREMSNLNQKVMAVTSPKMAQCFGPLTIGRSVALEGISTID